MTSQSNPLRLLIRNCDQLEASRLLLALPPAESLGELASLLPETELSVYTTVSEVQETAVQTVPESRLCYSHTPDALSGQFDAIVLFLQKSRPLVTALVDMLCGRLTENGTLFLVGENGTGIKSWRKRLSDWGQADSLASACHSGLISLLPDAKARSASSAPQNREL